MTHLTSTILLSFAALFAGFVDAIAGGGGIITLPAILAAGLPPHLALGTNKFQSTLGTFFSLANFHRKLKVIWRVALFGIPFSLIGSAGGAKLALIVPEAWLAKVILVLLPVAALGIFFSKPSAAVRDAGRYSGPRFWGATLSICFLLGLYDGFFGPGTGTFLIIALALVARMPLINATATAKTFNLASNAGSLATFLMGGFIHYPIALSMATANICGNLLGSHFAI